MRVQLSHSRLLQVSLLALMGCGAPAHPARDDSANNTARIGFWNVRKLGEDTQKNTPALCALIRQHFDVLALAEVMADDITGDIAALRACLEAEFSVLQTAEARPQGTGPHREHLIVLLRRGLADVCSGWQALRYAAAPAQWAAAHTGEPFLRPPAFLCVRVADGTELLLGAYHARWGSGDPAEVAKEIAWLDDVLAEAPAHFASTSDAILLGDLNLGPEGVTRASGLRCHTEGTGSTLAVTGQPSAHLYDQLLLGPEAALSLDDAQVTDVREEVGGGPEYRRTISDHLPIVARLHPTRIVHAKQAQ